MAFHSAFGGGLGTPIPKREPAPLRKRPVPPVNTPPVPPVNTPPVPPVGNSRVPKVGKIPASVHRVVKPAVHPAAAPTANALGGGFDHIAQDVVGRWKPEHQSMYYDIVESKSPSPETTCPILQILFRTVNFNNPDNPVATTMVQVLRDLFDNGAVHLPTVHFFFMQHIELMKSDEVREFVLTTDLRHHYSRAACVRECERRVMAIERSNIESTADDVNVNWVKQVIHHRMAGPDSCYFFLLEKTCLYTGMELVESSEMCSAVAQHFGDKLTEKRTQMLIDLIPLVDDPMKWCEDHLWPYFRRNAGRGQSFALVQLAFLRLAKNKHANTEGKKPALVQEAVRFIKSIAERKAMQLTDEQALRLREIARDVQQGRR